MRILHLVSCRGWSSDAYWAARAGRELGLRGHAVTLGCRRGTDAAVIDRVREEGVRDVEVFEFAGGFRPPADVADVRRLTGAMARADVVHVHRGKEHWLAAVAARVGGGRVPLVRTRHIAQAVRAHAGNRWLYRRATALVVAVTEAIRRQYLAAGLVDPARVVTLHGGADDRRYRPGPPDPALRARLGGVGGAPLVGMVAGFRVMKGHDVVLDALERLGAAGLRPRVVFVGRGALEPAIRERVRRAGLDGQVAIAGWAQDLPAVLAALDLALYVPVESDGMSRVLFECLAAGRPLIAARVGAAAETLADGEDALLVPGGDADALADALARALGDAALRARLAEAGRRGVVERYSGARLAEALEARYAALAR
jgi:glycosyltransferase involved in cell wall biosynthesis